MSTLTQLLTQERVLRGRIEKYIQNAKKTALNRRTQGFYETRSAELKELWVQYSALDLQIMQIYYEERPDKESTSKNVDPEYISEDYYSSTEAKYSDYLSELNDGLRKFMTETTSVKTDSNEPTSMITVHQEPALPRISLPKFNGDYDMWRSFCDMFTSLVHNNVKLSPVQKLYHLKSCLVGEAEQVLRHTPITDADYIPAWNKLKGRFENTRILVNHQLKRLINQPKLNIETAKGIKSLIDTTEECLQQLKGLQVDTQSWDVLLIHLLVQKLPFYTLKLWEEEQGANEELPNIGEFKTFLMTRLKVLESIADAVGSKPMHAKPSDQFKSKTAAYHVTREGRCPACGSKHFIMKCHKYNRMTPEEKHGVITKAQLCLNCLSGNHSQANCTSKYRCFKCKQRHHTSIHQDKSREMTTQGTPNYKGNANDSKLDVQEQESFHNTTKSDVTQVFVTRQNVRALLSTALVTAKCGSNQATTLRCLIDPGSQSSFLTTEACKRLGAQCTPTSIAITGIGTSLAANSCNETSVQLQSMQSTGPVVEETFLVMNKITNPLPRQRISKESLHHIAGLTLADPTYWKPGKIDALLGANVYAQIVQSGLVRGTKTSPVAINTLFGWILLGPTTNKVHREVISLVATTENDLSQQLRQFFEIEEYPTHPVFKEEEVVCQTIFETTHERTGNGQYQVKLPFVNNEIPKLGESRPQALARFIALQKQFRRNPILAKDYTACLDEYLKLDHMTPLIPAKNNKPYYYIPHHAVFKDSTTTKLRVVFDASSKTTNGKSLNDYLLKGPILQPKLFAILLKWRKHRIVMTADIEKMYRMILIHPEQRSFQRIIWTHPTTGQIQDYELKTVTFGTTSAPYLAIRTLQQLANDERDNWPMAAEVTRKDFYVDDLLTGTDDVPTAKRLQNELINMMHSGGFNLRKWASSHKDLLDHLPPEYCEKQGVLNICEEKAIKTLGIQWFPANDYFTFKFAPRGEQALYTKRSILSEIASLYDPLGWLAPVIVVAKMLMQAMWITGCTWDEPASFTIVQQWRKFKEDLTTLPKLKIPRWIHYTTSAGIQLHGFCDASSRAYAAVLYLRVTQEDGSISSTLLTAKTRVAPTKPTTIPRLELNGAVVLARLIKTTVSDMEFTNIPIYAWTDSTIVLQWIKEHPSRWKTYVANRVVEIQESMKYETWQHVSTTDNPADLASRGTTVGELISKKMWWHGPEWLAKPVKYWPNIKPHDTTTNLEAKVVCTANFVLETQHDIFARYSSFPKTLRIVALLLRFMANCKDIAKRQIGPISSVELRNAEGIILREVQRVSFPIDYSNLSQNKPLPPRSKLLQLTPFLDAQGLIRLKGRLAHASIPYAKKHPIILPKTHHIVSLIIDQLHRDTLHGGTSIVLATSRNKYWILDGRRAISTRIHKCITCYRYRKESCQQLMGDLPKARVNVAKPFSKVGIDYAGPVVIKASLCRKAKLLKGYLCIFVCMATKAIHIELVSALTTDAFIAALRRFISRRGLCNDIYSDCGTNFVGAKSTLDKELKRAITVASKEAVHYCTQQAINWHFNPPAAPNFGGIWESNVRSVKHHLRRSLGNITLTFEEYATLLTQIEAILNSRPLCYISSDPSNLQILTPGHFLIGQELNMLPEPDYSQEATLTQRWKHIQQRTQQFWKQWSQDYLHQLQTRPKWQMERKNLQIGDVVLVMNENTPPAKWPLGIVEEVYPGADGLIRVAQVKTQANILRRPISKLSRLPVDAAY